MGILRLFEIDDVEATFERRGFHCHDEGVRTHLEDVGKAFLKGYRRSLQDADTGRLTRSLNRMSEHSRGFAFEGAAMGLVLRGLFGRSDKALFKQFAHRDAVEHVFLAYVGAGWMLARLRGRRLGPLRDLDPLLGWLTFDGYGFHEGYFSWDRYAGGGPAPRSLSGYARRAFDQGLGRSLWFIYGTDIGRIGGAVTAFADSRQGDLWSGVGLACAYAGGAGDDRNIRALWEITRIYRPHVAQGVIFAAKARVLAGTKQPHTESACRIICGLSATEAAGIADDALARVVDRTSADAYEQWRGHVRDMAMSVCAA
jgi:hypothetical protein